MRGGGTQSFVVSPSPQTHALFTIHRYHHFIHPVYSYSEDPGGKKSREHVCKVEYAGGTLSEKSKSFFQIHCLSNHSDIGEQ